MEKKKSGYFTGRDCRSVPGTRTLCRCHPLDENQLHAPGFSARLAAAAEGCVGGGGDVEGGGDGGGGGGCGCGGGRTQLLPGRVCDIEPLSLLVVLVTSRLVCGAAETTGVNYIKAYYHQVFKHGYSLRGLRPSTAV
ncbi:hypothetical protein E2C01_071055 [Portunus trituberculatus]|uniref:Uncharacterized protein n=1 Tax=Portunus trituberculatus TaxID=210409 RepID=A0A5B7I702_PORTR|nr:hypothetical protein [Portunus trituberculatus]